MEYMAVRCPSCNHGMKVAANAAGRKLKCSKCEHIFPIPAPASSEPTSPEPDPLEAAFADAAPAEAEAIPTASRTDGIKPCPFCGEDIRATAVKCKHCGEFLSTPPAGHRQPTPAHSTAAHPTAHYPGAHHPTHKPAATAHSQNHLTPAEYIVATLFCPVGLVIGIVWAAQKKMAKAKTMLTLSTLCCVIAVCGVIGVRIYLTPESDMYEEGELASTYDPPVVIPFDSRPGMPGGPGGGQSGRVVLEEELDVEDQPLPIQRALRANVRIESGNSLGSGVVLQLRDDLAVIITNRHVIDPNYTSNNILTSVPEFDSLPEPQIRYFTRQQNVGKLVWIAPDGIDLALIEATCPKEVEPVPWYPLTQAVTGEDVFAIGNPVGLNWTYTRGVISAMRRRVQGEVEIPIIQTDTSIAGGSSGGGLYTEEGELIGINTFMVDPSRSSGLGFAIRLSILEQLAPEMLEVLAAKEGVEEPPKGDIESPAAPSVDPR